MWVKRLRVSDQITVFPFHVILNYVWQSFSFFAKNKKNWHFSFFRENREVKTKNQFPLKKPFGTFLIQNPHIGGTYFDQTYDDNLIF